MRRLPFSLFLTSHQITSSGISQIIKIIDDKYHHGNEDSRRYCCRGRCVCVCGGGGGGGAGGVQLVPNP